MPAWGLSEEQRTIESGMGPWGLHPGLLSPAKVTTDPVHGDIYTTWLEQTIVDSPPFQRLRRIRQLGTTHLVYPGATHTRFSHSLGALRVAQDLLDAVLTQHEGRHPVSDLVTQWRPTDTRARHIARSIVLARLGALLHDLGHVPFGHSIEDDLKVLVEHDANEDRFVVLWGQLAEFVRERVRGSEHFRGENEPALATLDTLLNENGELQGELRPMVVSKGPHTKDLGELAYPFAADLVGNTICADLLDYLLRDHLYTGLPVALGRRFMTAFFIVPEGRGEFEKRLALNIMRDGHERTDVVTELLKALRYRYELSERALVHHAKLSADAMLGKALELWSDALWLQAACERIAGFDDAEELRRRGDVEEMRQRFHDRLAAEYERDVVDKGREVHEVDLVVRRKLEDELVDAGDDGLLEKLAAFRGLKETDTRVQAAGGFSPRVLELHRHTGELASAFLQRRLFKVAGRVGIEDAPAQELYDNIGKDARRRSDVERAAERFAGLRGGPQVLIWLPNPTMRVKVAEVLVDDGNHIDRFAAYEAPRARRGSDIYGGHSRLWGLWIFTRPDMTKAQREDVLAYLAERLGVAWEQQREHWGSAYWQWVDQLILARLLNGEPGDNDVQELVTGVAAATSARGDADTCADRRRRLARLTVVKQRKARRREQAGE